MLKINLRVRLDKRRKIRRVTIFSFLHKALLYQKSSEKRNNYSQPRRKRGKYRGWNWKKKEKQWRRNSKSAIFISPEWSLKNKSHLFPRTMLLLFTISTDWWNLILISLQLWRPNSESLHQRYHRVLLHPLGQSLSHWWSRLSPSTISTTTPRLSIFRTFAEH